MCLNPLNSLMLPGREKKRLPLQDKGREGSIAVYVHLSLSHHLLRKIGTLILFDYSGLKMVTLL